MSELTKTANRSTSRSSSAHVRRVVCLAMLCAIAYVVMFLSKTLIFAPIQIAGFLTFDLKDVVIAIGGFIFGPLSAFIISAVVSLIEMVTVSDTGPIGLLMNVLSTIVFVCPAAFIYKCRHKLSRAVIGLILGGILMIAVMLLWNYLITPLYQNVPRAVIADMLLPVFLPFNAVKGLMNGALTIILYKPVVTALRKARLVPELQASGGSGSIRSSKPAITIIAVIALATALLLALSLADII